MKTFTVKNGEEWTNKMIPKLVYTTNPKYGASDELSVSFVTDAANISYYTVLCFRKDNVALWSGTNKNEDVSNEPLARPLARTAHSFACSALVASLARPTALIRLHAHKLTHSRARRKVNDLMSQNDLVLSHSVFALSAFP